MLLTLSIAAVLYVTLCMGVTRKKRAEVRIRGIPFWWEIIVAVIMTTVLIAYVIYGEIRRGWTIVTRQ